MNKALLAVGVAGVLTYCVPTTTVKAVSIKDTHSYTDDIQPRAAGLIIQYGLSISSETGTILMSGSTISNDKMKSIGFTDIVVEYSSDGSNWKVEKNVSDIVKSNALNYRLSEHSISVTGGYYYRITCNHYAKESGLFGSSQSVENTSNSVWVD